MQIEHSDFQDQLVRGLAHRMNNILTLFHGYVGLLMDNKELDRQTMDGLHKIKEGAKAASELMDRTHSLVRPSSLIWREIDLGEYIHLLRPCFEMMKCPNTVLELDCPEGLPHVWADMNRVKTVVVELVRNACEATPNGGTIRIKLRPEEGPVASASQPIQWVSLTVTDNGPGIPPENIERIFAPFFTSKTKQSNAGLGLTVARGFIQQIGGVIRVESEPGKTQFQLLLPSRSGK
jgi:two-component system, cell cycle sensor histidine kinase and response regulator CckA